MFADRLPEIKAADAIGEPLHGDIDFILVLSVLIRKGRGRAPAGGNEVGHLPVIHENGAFKRI